jgi:hypothetical protein
MADIVDKLTNEVNALIAKIDSVLPGMRKARHRVTVEHFDDDGPDDGDDGDDGDDLGDVNVSNPSSSVDHSDDNDGGPNDDDGDEDETADDDEEELEKAFYPRAVEASYMQSNTRTERPGPRAHSSHRANSPIVSSRGFDNAPTATPVVQPPPRTKFDAVVDRIVAEEGENRINALTLARRRHPDLYAAHQSTTAGSTAQQQHYSRSDMRGSYFKAAPAPGTAESLIAAEMKKGLNYECAAQRVAQLHGYRAWDRRDAIAKRADDIAENFEAVAEQLWLDNDVDRTEALRIVRKGNAARLR